MTIEHVQPSEHAQVGALLARCRYVELGQDENGWWAWVRLLGRHSLRMGEGKTQLEAIRNAVEAAEGGEGVRLTTEKITSQVESAMRHYGETFAPFREIDGSVVLFDKTWGSTSCGFPGVGGQAMTTSTVLVIYDGQDAVVYIAGRFAYHVEETTKEFHADLKDMVIKGAADKSISRYGKKVTTKC